MQTQDTNYEVTLKYSLPRSAPATTKTLRVWARDKKSAIRFAEYELGAIIDLMHVYFYRNQSKVEAV